MSMKTFFTVKFALLPLAIFVFLIVRGMPEAAIGAGFVVALIVCAWRLYVRDIKSLEIAALAIFGALAAGLLMAPDVVVGNAVPLAFAGLGLFSIATVLVRKPWTAEFSRAAYPEAVDDPLFVQINMILTGLWGVLFLLLALAHAHKAGGIVTTAIVVAGALASILGPRFLIRFALAQRLRSLETYHWSAQLLGGARGDDDFDAAVVGAGRRPHRRGIACRCRAEGSRRRAAFSAGRLLPDLSAQASSRRCAAGLSLRCGPARFLRRVGGRSGNRDPGAIGGRAADRVAPRRHTYRFSNRVIDVPGDWHAYVAELARQFPAEGGGFEALFASIRAIHDAMYSPLVGSGGIPGLKMTIETMLEFQQQNPFAVQWLDKPFDQLVARHIGDPQARQLITALTGYISDGSESLTCAQMVPLFGYYFHGGYHPVGGSAKFTDALAAAIRERDGELWLNSPVAKICIENGRAAGLVLADGRRISARAIVANSDLKRTFLDLVDPADIPNDFRAEIAAAEPASSAFTVHLGVDFVPDIRPAVMVRGEQNIYIAAMSLIDPSAAPLGHATLTVITLLPQAEAQNWFKNRDWKEWRQSPDYRDRKKQLGDTMIAAAETVMPDLSRHIVYRDEASPVTFTRYDWSSTGAIYGVRRNARLRGARSPVPGLVVAGSATHGPGVEAALISGAYAADALLPGLLAKPPSTLGRSSKKAA
jgi:phytoene dehydrogenase-like protein